MKKGILSLLTGAALLGSVGVASAAELMVLTSAAMDGITAGQIGDITQSNASSVTVTQSITNTANGPSTGDISQSGSNSSSVTTNQTNSASFGDVF